MREKALELMEQGNLEEAYRKYSSAITVTSRMISEFIEVLKKMEIEYYIAPYEADAQLAYLYKIGYISWVISEDSDLIPFGCDKVIFNFDKKLHANEFDLNKKSQKHEINLEVMDNDSFLLVCILAGCDYISSIKGIGFKKAWNLISSEKTIKKVLAKLENDRYYIPSNYFDDFCKAFIAFKFQIVYDPINKKDVHLNDILLIDSYSFLTNFSELSFIGIVSTDSQHYLAQNEYRKTVYSENKKENEEIEEEKEEEYNEDEKEEEGEEQNGKGNNTSEYKTKEKKEEKNEVKIKSNKKISDIIQANSHSIFNHCERKVKFLDLEINNKGLNKGIDHRERISDEKSSPLYKSMKREKEPKLKMKINSDYLYEKALNVFPNQEELVNINNIKINSNIFHTKNNDPNSKGNLDSLNMINNNNSGIKKKSSVVHLFKFGP